MEDEYYGDVDEQTNCTHDQHQRALHFGRFRKSVISHKKSIRRSTKN